MKKTIYVDASSLKSDSLCDRRYLLHIIRGHTRGLRAENYKAGYGTAFHAFLEQYYSISPPTRGAAMRDLIQIGLKAYKKYEPYVDTNSVFEFRTSEHLAKVIQAYHERYQRGDSLSPLTFEIPGTTKALLESKFCIPWYEDEAIVIYLTGTIDMVSDYFGQPIIVDHKSTHTQAANINKFFDEFDMNIQTQFYVWVFKRLTGMAKYLPIMINGIFVKAWTKKAKEEQKFDGVNFQRSRLIEYTDSQMNQFEEWLMVKLDWIKQLAMRPEDDLAAPNYAACHGRYGSCELFPVCKESKDLQSKILNFHFKVEPYSPLNFND